MGNRLITASERGNIEQVLHILNKGVDVNSVYMGYTALLLASDMGHWDIVKALLERGANVDHLDWCGYTALIYASEKGHLDIVKALLEKGANVDHSNKNGDTALICASFEGHLDIVKALLEKGANVDHQAKDGWTALILASSQGHSDIVKALLEKGANVDHQDKDGLTALIWTSYKGHVDVVKALLEKGANVDHPNKNGLTALISASLEGHIDIVKALLEKRANVYYTNKNGNTALDIARDKGFMGIVNVLLQAQDCNIPGISKSDDLITASRRGNIEEVLHILNKGVDVNSVDKDGWTALMYASFEGHVDIVKALLEKGANVNHTNKNGNTALIKASDKGHLDIVKALLEKGANVDHQAKVGWTALISASLEGHFDIVKALLEKRANVYYTNKYGKTALDVARDKGFQNIVDVLVQTKEYNIPGISKSNSNPKPLDEVSDLKNQITLLQEQSARKDRQLAITKGRELIRNTLSIPNSPVILNIPIEYVQDCTYSMFAKPLGEGGSGKVYLAVDTKYPETKFVVKKVDPNGIPSSFRRELEALRRLHHPNIIRLYATTKHQLDDILLLEYAEGGDLSSYWNNQEKRSELSAMTRINILCEISCALHFLHSGGVIDKIDQRKYTIFHRDIKSSNICLGSDYSAKLIDCGLAQFQVVGDATKNITLPQTLLHNTTSTKVVGTKGYMCPKIKEGSIPMDKYQAECDVYSFGVVMLEMITGTLQMTNNYNLTDYKEDREGLLQNFDKYAGKGWMEMKNHLAMLALECVSSLIDKRPSTFEVIANRLALIRAGMTRIVDSHYTSDADACLTQRSCCICNCTCEERHSIICPHGHMMDAQCCMNKLVSFCNIPTARMSSRKFGCPCCAVMIDIEKLVGKIPFEYVTMLQQRYDDFDHIKQLDQRMTLVESGHSRLESRQSSLEIDLRNVDSRVSTSEVKLKEINKLYVDVWKQLADFATELFPCPRYIYIEPILPTKDDRNNIKSWFEGIFTKKMRIYFICEKSWDRVLAFEQIMTREWVEKAAPVVSFTLQILLKCGTFGWLDSESLSVLAGCFSGLVRTKFPQFSRISETLFTKNSRASSKVLLNSLKKEECVVKVMKESYEVLKEEADRHVGWKDLLVPIMTPGVGHRWVKKELVTPDDHRVPLDSLL